DLIHDPGSLVVFGMHPAVIKRVAAFRDLQEARTLFKAFWPHSGNLHEFIPARYPAAGFTASHDFFGERPIDAGAVFEERETRGIEVDAYVIYDRAHLCLERFGQFFLVYVVLIPTTTARLGINLDDFGEGILEASTDGDGAPYGEVEFGE